MKLKNLLWNPEEVFNFINLSRSLSYFAAANLFATASQFTTLKNALM